MIKSDLLRILLLNFQVHVAATSENDSIRIPQPLMNRQRQGDRYGELSEEEGIATSDDSPNRLRRKTQNTRIIGGGEAPRNRYPYMASITYERGK